eukprot:6490988-Amphidinium_carterae.2
MKQQQPAAATAAAAARDWSQQLDRLLKHFANNTCTLATDRELFQQRERGSVHESESAHGKGERSCPNALVVLDPAKLARHDGIQCYSKTQQLTASPNRHLISRKTQK